MSKIYQTTLGQGKSIVLVHGWAMHGGVWRDFAEQLAQHYRVTCIDLPGHGYSEPCADFTLTHVSELLADAIVEEHSCWLGWSLGATIVLDLAARFPERVNSLVLLGGNPRFVVPETTSVNTWPGMSATVFDAFADNLSKDCRATLAQFLSLQVQGLPDSRAHLKQLKNRLFEHPGASQPVLQSGLAILKQADMRSTLATLTMPILSALAEKDMLVPVAVGQYLTDSYPNIKLNVIKNAGHAVFLSHGQEVLSLVSRFMDEH